MGRQARWLWMSSIGLFWSPDYGSASTDDLLSRVHATSSEDSPLRRTSTSQHLPLAILTGFFLCVGIDLVADMGNGFGCEDGLTTKWVKCNFSLLHVVFPVRYALPFIFSSLWSFTFHTYPTPLVETLTRQEST
jgi:hypothetical protein